MLDFAYQKAREASSKIRDPFIWWANFDYIERKYNEVIAYYYAIGCNQEQVESAIMHFNYILECDIHSLKLEWAERTYVRQNPKLDIKYFQNER